VWLWGSQDGGVGRATCYGLDGPGIKSQWRRDFPCSEAHPVFCTMGTGCFSGKKQLEHEADHPPPSIVGLRMGRSHTSTSSLCLHSHVFRWPLLMFVTLRWSSLEFLPCNFPILASKSYHCSYRTQHIFRNCTCFTVWLQLLCCQWTLDLNKQSVSVASVLGKCLSLLIV
jgi:hypothetical protein